MTDTLSPLTVGIACVIVAAMALGLGYWLGGLVRVEQPRPRRSATVLRMHDDLARRQRALRRG